MTWTADELAEIESNDEVHLSSRRDDGSLRPEITMWIVRVDDDVIVRSARQVNPWYRRALASGTGRIRIGRLERDVDFEESPSRGADIDAAYHAKYDRYGASIVGTVVGEAAHARTLRLLPAD